MRASPVYPDARRNQQYKWMLVAAIGFVVLYLSFGGIMSSPNLDWEDDDEIETIKRNQEKGGVVRLSELLAVGLDLTEQANQAIRQVKAGGSEAQHLRVKGKTAEGVDEPVTEADASSNSVFINGLRSRFPGISILSEETEPEPAKVISMAQPKDLPIPLPYDADLPLKDLLVIFDPLDATKEFTEDLLQYVTTMMCIVYDGHPIAGIVSQVFEDAAPIYGVVADGHHVMEGGVFGTDAEEPVGEAANTVTFSMSHTGGARDVVANYLEGQKPLPAGGSGYKSLLVLNGEANAYVHVTKIKVWDVCAGEAVIRAAGGSFTDIHGNDIEYSKDKYILENGLLLQGAMSATLGT
eukprot:CAMPEP_0113934154 /NCGR_PEP_ID=MMETSP1339-20121228/1483_1 /TAXON_ID=94617 /ORGANISM="Fibrocapsa japonica" /LENGTH=351 /DNA_ID=CAMNT_0000935831 /DNA_START=22 /DNA_END=1078 /DNA_ORIENTATION=+ /assembly_acc=CAM_ASM_000762